MTIPSITPKGPEQLVEKYVESGNFLRVGLIVLVVVVWGILAIGIYIYFNYRNSS
jgi:hypothetical protein